jgi:hypothetical protein
LERLSQFHNSAAFITDMNALQHKQFCADGLLASDSRGLRRAPQNSRCLVARDFRNIIPGFRPPERSPSYGSLESISAALVRPCDRKKPSIAPLTLSGKLGRQPVTAGRLDCFLSTGFWTSFWPKISLNWHLWPVKVLEWRAQS